jgi:hypothetical protein
MKASEANEKVLGLKDWILRFGSEISGERREKGKSCGSGDFI